MGDDNNGTTSLVVDAKYGSLALLLVIGGSGGIGHSFGTGSQAPQGVQCADHIQMALQRTEEYRREVNSLRSTLVSWKIDYSKAEDKNRRIWLEIEEINRRIDRRGE